MRILRFLSVLWFCGLSAFSHSQESATNGIWIDVRSEQEVQEHKVKGTHNIPHGEIADRIAEITTDKQARIHLFCRSGGRANIAKKALEELGYTNVLNEGGFIEVEAKFDQQ